MLKTININSLIQTEILSTVSKETQSSYLSLENSFLKLLNEKYEQIVITTTSKEKENIAISFKNNLFQFSKKKEDKKIIYTYEFEKKFLKVNQRKAFEEDFFNLKKELEKSITILKETENRELLIEKTDSIENNTSLQEKLSTEFNCNCTEKIQLIKAVTNKSIYPILIALTHFIKQIQTEKEKPSQKISTDSLSETIEACKELLCENKYKNVKVSNKSTSQLKSAFLLSVDQHQAIFLQKSTLENKKIVLNFDSKSISSNQGEVTEAVFNWFKEKLQSIGQGLISGQMQLLAK